jgi:hypothetical protein
MILKCGPGTGRGRQSLPVLKQLPAVMPMVMAPVVMMPVMPTVVVPVVMVPLMVMVPADLFGLEAIDLVLPHDCGLRAGSARQHQVLFRRNRR